MTLIEDALHDHLSAVDHTRKQVQVHAAAKSIALRFAKKAPASFGESFHFHYFLFSKTDDLPVTVEEYVPGIFQKYVNKTGNGRKPHQRNTKMFMPKLKLFAIFLTLTPAKK